MLNAKVILYQTSNKSVYKSSITIQTVLTAYLNVKSAELTRPFC